MNKFLKFFNQWSKWNSMQNLKSVPQNGWLVAIINNMNIDIQNFKFAAPKMAQLLQFQISKVGNSSVSPHFSST